LCRSGKNKGILEKALKIAHVKDFARELPRGIKSLIGEKGIKLSGGEKQRVGIARAIYQEPEILLLDEATSRLDIESEKKIQTALHDFFQNITAIVIAHRLSTIKEMDKIVVMDQGEVLEVGTFNDLIKQKGKFYELWQKQKF
jgi:ATP-binding cassette subfamily B protein